MKTQTSQTRKSESFSTRVTFRRPTSKQSHCCCSFFFPSSHKPFQKLKHCSYSRLCVLQRDLRHLSRVHDETPKDAYFFKNFFCHTRDNDSTFKCFRCDRNMKRVLRASAFSCVVMFCGDVIRQRIEGATFETWNR